MATLKRVMEPGEIPPVIGGTNGAESNSVSRGRWWLHVCVLAIFPVVPGVAGLLRQSNEALLPKSVGGLLGVSVFEIAFFGVFFLLAWLASRVKKEQLLLKWRRGGLPLALGLGYSVALRIAVFVVVMVLAAVWTLLTRAKTQDLQQFRPQFEHLMNTQAILNNPLYFTVCLTLISFVVGGLREELWRAAMLAGIRVLFPAQFQEWSGKIGAIIIVALLFGFGHTAQGVLGVMMTTVLGIGLGAIMVVHRSIWEAAIAHGFFDATTFATLYVVMKYFPGQIPGL